MWYPSDGLIHINASKLVDDTHRGTFHEKTTEYALAHISVRNDLKARNREKNIRDNQQHRQSDSQICAKKPICGLDGISENGRFGPCFVHLSIVRV